MSRWKPDAAGRLTKAALALFEQQGYEETTVAEIADAADLTRRTFFRYFADKREVLFSGSQELEHRWVQAMAAAPAPADPLSVAAAGFEPIAEMFVERHQFARRRARVISSHAELQERELIKLQSLAGAMASALTVRGVSDNAAVLAAQSVVTVFRIAFEGWVGQDDPAALRRLMDEALDELRAVTAAPDRGLRPQAARVAAGAAR